MEEKFQKLKEVYQKLREEHIGLIRSKAEVDKQLVCVKHAGEEAVKVKEELLMQLNELMHEKSKHEENLVRSAETASEVETLKAAKEALESQNSVSHISFNCWLRSEIKLILFLTGFDALSYDIGHKFI